MRLLPQRLGRVRPTYTTILLLVIFFVAFVSAQTTDDATADATTSAAQTTDDPSTTDSIPSVTDTTAATTDPTSATSASENTVSTTSESLETSTSMDSTTTDSSSETSSTTDSSTTTSSVSTTTTSTSSSSTSTAAPIVTVPPTAGAPYLQTSNTPEGTVFIAVGAILGLIGLAVLAWRGIVAWSVNRSVRRAAMAHSSESKRLLRGSRKKRSAVYTAAPAGDVSLDKLGAATRASYKPSKRVPSSNSGLFFSPTAGGAGVAGSGSHASLHAAGNRGSSYLPAGYYAAAGSSTPVRDSGGVPPMGHSPAAGMSSPAGYPPSSPSLPPIGTYYDAPHNARHSYIGASTSSLNLSQAPQGRAPSAYLEDLFESHTPPRGPESGRHDRN